MYFFMSSSHLILGLAFLRFRCMGSHSVTVRVHRSSFILATCPAHCHFSCFILSIMSCTPVYCLTHSFILRSLLVIPCFFEFFFNLSCILFVTAQVWHPYVITACMH